MTKVSTWDHFIELLPAVAVAVGAVLGAVFGYLATWAQWRREREERDRTRFVDVKREGYVRFRILIRDYDEAREAEKEARGAVEQFGQGGVADPLDPRYEDYGDALGRAHDAKVKRDASLRAVLDCIESLSFVAPLRVFETLDDLASALRTKDDQKRQRAEWQFRISARKDLGVHD
jgi:hypothetical protein